jgi:hypothetical protein
MCLDGSRGTALFCQRCRANCLADIGVWMSCTTARKGHNGAARITQGYRQLELPAAEPVFDHTRKLHKVKIPIRRRTVVDDVTEDKASSVVAPEILFGYNAREVLAAAEQWRWANGARKRILENDIDPVDVLLAANSSTGYREKSADGVTTIQTDRFRVRVDSTTNTILNAYKD